MFPDNNQCVYPDPNFDRKKEQILHDLENPEVTDLSPKGSVDCRILPIMETINSHPDYVTTSSCSGRIAVYCDPITTPLFETQTEDISLPVENSQTTTKGGGHWTFVTHDPVITTSLSLENVTELLLPNFNIVEESGVPNKASRLIWFRFEPMILHVQARDVLAGRNFMDLSFTEGFRNTGLGISTKKRMIVSVRDASKVEVPIAFLTEEKQAQLLVSRSYLLLLINLANQKFKRNFEHMERYNEALKTQLPQAKGFTDPLKEKALRREIKRAAGLERQKHLNAQKNSQDITQVVLETTLENCT